MLLQQFMENKLKEAFKISHLEVINESHRHHVPVGSESHFKIILVTPHFEGKKLTERQRLVYSLFSEELKHQIHALSLQTLTPQEWEERKKQSLASPPCLGGSK